MYERKSGASHLTDMVGVTARDPNRRIPRGDRITSKASIRADTRGTGKRESCEEEFVGSIRFGREKIVLYENAPQKTFSFAKACERLRIRPNGCARLKA
jgi:hypothetical protein